jgi:hypothetical protein
MKIDMSDFLAFLAGFCMAVAIGGWVLLVMTRLVQVLK